MYNFSRVFGFSISSNSMLFVKYSGSLTELGSNLYGENEFLPEIDSIDGLSINGSSVSLKGLNESMHELLVEAAYKDADSHISEIITDFEERLERTV